MRKLPELIFGLIVLIALVAISMSISSGDEKSIRDWAESKDYQIEKIEKTIFDNGPFWIRDDHHRIYRVELKDELEHDRVTYFRFGSLFTGLEQEWYDN